MENFETKVLTCNYLISDLLVNIFKCIYRIRRCPVPLCLVPCKFGKILVIDHFVEKNLY